MKIRVMSQHIFPKEDSYRREVGDIAWIKSWKAVSANESFSAGARPTHWPALKADLSLQVYERLPADRIPAKRSDDSIPQAKSHGFPTRCLVLPPVSNISAFLSLKLGDRPVVLCGSFPFFCRILDASRNMLSSIANIPKQKNWRELRHPSCDSVFLCHESWLCTDCNLESLCVRTGVHKGPVNSKMKEIEAGYARDPTEDKQRLDGWITLCWFSFRSKIFFFNYALSVLPVSRAHLSIFYGAWTRWERNVRPRENNILYTPINTNNQHHFKTWQHSRTF